MLSLSTFVFEALREMFFVKKILIETNIQFTHNTYEKKILELTRSSLRLTFPFQSFSAEVISFGLHFRRVILVGISNVPET